MVSERHRIGRTFDVAGSYAVPLFRRCVFWSLAYNGARQQRLW